MIKEMAKMVPTTFYFEVLDKVYMSFICHLVCQFEMHF